MNLLPAYGIVIILPVVLIVFLIADRLGSSVHTDEEVPS
jgi:hypothetical protein